MVKIYKNINDICRLIGDPRLLETEPNHLGSGQAI